MKLSILLLIFILLNACQGRNMPMKSSPVKHSIEHNTTAIAAQKKAIIVIEETKKSHIKPSPKKSKKKKLTPIVHRSREPVHRDTDSSKERAKNNLPPLPYIPSIEESKKITSSLHKPKMHTKPIDVTIDTIIDTQVSQPRESFSGGGIANNLDMATIRIGKSSDYTSIIFDSYQYEGKDNISTKKAPVSGTYLFTYEPDKKRIVGIIDGYNAFTALLNDQRELFSDSKVVKNIYVLKHLGSDGIKFVIKLRKNVRVNIFDVKNPGRIIVNLFPI